MLRELMKKLWPKRIGKTEPADGAASSEGNPNGGQGGATPLRAQPEIKRKILVAVRGLTVSPGVLDYAAQLAQRLDYDLLVLNLKPAPPPEKKFSLYQKYLEEKFAGQARAAWSEVQGQLVGRGISYRQMARFGEVGQAVADLCQEFRRIDFVITDGLKDEEITGKIPLPVFSITGYQGEMVMAKKQGRLELTSWGKTAVFGGLTAALYAAVFLNGGTVMSYFTLGGWYAALPIATVFVFSFVHGTFAHHLWEALGIEAPRKATQPRPAAKRPIRRQRPRAQLRLKS
ncbi:MAG: hypothetical protein FJ134_08855 [Deltaproteobacteria bacterium]|nr:hypothetical protein [Deltaproteobacteria bacterium]